MSDEARDSLVISEEQAPRTIPDPAVLENELRKQRRKVDFDTYDAPVQQLLTMIDSNAIDIAPAYQRQYRWKDDRASQLIESILLGIPVPSLYMATNRDGTWELVDGVQRVSTVVKFAGSDDNRRKLDIGGPLVLKDLDKLQSFNGLTFADLPQTLQLQFMLRPLKVITLSDKSNRIVRFDLFERLNRGGVNLTDQEIRSCVFRGRFANELEDMARNEDFLKVVRLPENDQKNGTYEECVLRFFAFHDRYLQFDHSVVGFLNTYMDDASKTFDFKNQRKLFNTTFQKLAALFPEGLSRPGRKTTTSLIFFEGVAVGAAFAIEKSGDLISDNLEWLSSDELRKVTTGFTNSPTAVTGRIEFCRDGFLGKK